MSLVNAKTWNPLYKELAYLIGEEKTIVLFNEYKGTQQAFPMRLVSREHLKKLIQLESSYKTVNQLARQTGYSERNIRRLLKEIDYEED